MPALPHLTDLTSPSLATPHTFILQEFGYDVEDCAIRRPKDEHLIGPEDEATCSPTYYIVETGTNLVFVGPLTSSKGLRVLLEAFVAAHAHRTDLILTIVGDGDDRVHLEQLTTPMGDEIRFLGFQSQQDVADALADADALVLPSFAEGLPVVLMEALAAGKPVICTQLAGVGELVENGISGFIVPAGDVESLATRICDMAEDPERRQKMGEAGRKKVCAEFDIRLEAARIGSLFSDTHGGEIRPEPFKATS